MLGVKFRKSYVEPEHGSFPSPPEIVFVTYDASKIIGDSNNIQLYDPRPGRGLPSAFSEILCNQCNKVFVIINPNINSVSAELAKSFIRKGPQNRVYMYDYTYNGEYVPVSKDNLDPYDTLIFLSDILSANNLRDISGLSDHYECMRFILKKLGNAEIYGPKSRTEKYITPEEKMVVINENVVIQPKKIFSFVTAVGIGDLLRIRSIFDDKKTEYSHICISPSYDVIERYRDDGEKYRKFIKRFMTDLFKLPYYRVIYGQYSLCKIPDKIIEDEHFIPVKPDLQHIMCAGKRFDGDYITILTKVRGIDHEDYLNHKESFFSALRSVPNHIKVMVLGEQRLEQTKEYIDLPGKVYSIYEDIIQNVPNAIDKTFPYSSGDRTPDLDNIKQTCMYMRDAICNFSIGVGGLFCMALSVGKISAWVPKGSESSAEYSMEYFYNNTIDGICISPDPQDLIEKIYSCFGYKRYDTFETPIHLGLGDIIYIKAALDQTTYKKIIIKPKMNLLDDKSEAYKKHTIKFIKKFFPEPRYKIDFNSETEISGNPTHIYKRTGIIPVKPYYPKLLCEKTKIPERQYIVVHTKVKGLAYFKYMELKERFFAILKDLSRFYSIVLMGERNIEYSEELGSILKHNCLYSIYGDCIKNIENVIDLTENEDLIKAPKNTGKACYIMHYARAVITFGLGGNFCLASAVAGYHVGLILEHTYYDKIYDLEVVDNGFLTKDSDTFLKKISTLHRVEHSKKDIDWFLDEDGTFSFSSPQSLGDLILLVHILEHDDRVKRINISPFNGFLKFREVSYDAFWKYYKTFMDILTQKCTKPFNVTQRQYEFAGTDQICTSLGFDCATKPVYPQLTGPKPRGLKNYILFTSKVRSVELEHFNEIKEKYYETLRKLSEKYKLILIGERVPFHTEVEKSWYFCIYDDLMQSGIKFEDRTSDIGKITKVNEILTDCTLMSYAKAVIMIGNGGQWCMSLAADANVFSYMGPDVPLFQLGQLFLLHQKDWYKRHMYDNFGKFIEDIRKI